MWPFPRKQRTGKYCGGLAAIGAREWICEQVRRIDACAVRLEQLSNDLPVHDGGYRPARQI